MIARKASAALAAGKFFNSVTHFKYAFKEAYLSHIKLIYEREKFFLIVK